MDAITIILVILILLAISVLPIWPYSRTWGYYPSGALLILIVIFLVMLFRQT
ncbi:MAG: hypothetical protein K0R98_590 [Rickettsiaceae bacterium]|jgi:hypothetical protein|nr:hypothetical protein [Rickettsiaceae bacterium]